MLVAQELGNLPPGNQPGETKWQARKAAPLKNEIRLTAGKPITGVTIEQLIDQVVKGNKVRGQVMPPSLPPDPSCLLVRSWSLSRVRARSRSAASRTR